MRDYGLVVEVEGGAGFSLEKAHMKFSVSCRTLNRTIYNHKELQFFRFQGSLREKPEQSATPVMHEVLLYCTYSRSLKVGTSLSSWS